ncbi:Metallo-dependent hydrolase [Lentinus tigrinus ALCF2SS1-7]|uniref:adenosine deaminase n=1 Tax=Lentinus tigrinus ALCF2SS1-6 TaxID=1328759 RepID=A0A5C2SN13_9APHY|nr:Metallo-dependent hydrolase [Lentinus tigrinus ALCF2SS1-6]RPD67953.1 Metallo-dependent hydrolase [Lentinus tigrinus ALCF2SS1-7]
MEFLTARQKIVGTKIFDILSKMPKGGLLHIHLGATVRPDILLNLGLLYPAIHVRASAPITETTIKTTLPIFSALPKEEWTATCSLTDSSYKPDTWVPLQNARNNFSPALGGPEGFDRWVIDAMMINPSEAYGTHNTPDLIWKKFQSTFTVSEGMYGYIPLWTEYIRQFFLSSVEDGISYTEPRMIFFGDFVTGADGRKNVSHRDCLAIFDRVVKEVKEDLTKQGRGDDFLGSRIIYSTLRLVAPEQLEHYLEDCLALAQEFPHLIAGFDLVGAEDSLKPLIHYAEPLLKFIERQKELGLYIPFMFHAGETLGDGSPADMNLYDAILLGTKRIGHGFSLYKHPRLMELCKEREICIEVCPISNEILRLCGSMPMHPLPALMNQGLHVALCSDDPSIFGNMGLSFDFFQVFVASEVNTLATLREFVWDSIRFSSLSDDEKSRAYGMLERQWSKFIQYILTTYGKVEYAH